MMKKKEFNMKREILFRGKSKESGEWVYGTGFTDFLNIFPENRGRIWLWCDYKYDDGIGKGWIEIHHDSIGQFTGLTDKNGKKVFEGDILSFNKVFEGDIISFNNQYEPYFAEVVFETEDIGSCGCCYSAFQGSGFVGKVLPGSKYDYSWFSDDFKESEIVGNIFDNPEMVKND